MKKKSFKSTLGIPPRPENVERMFAFIGRVASEFASLETRLDYYLSYMINADNEKVGQILLKRHNSFPAKVSLFVELACLNLSCSLRAPPSDLERVNDSLMKCSRLRDHLMHSSHTGISDKEDMLHQTWTAGRKRKIPVKDGTIRFYVNFYGERSSFPQKNRMLTR